MSALLCFFIFLLSKKPLTNNIYQYRASLEYEKNAKPELTAQVQAMEKDLVAMAQEAEMLRADIAKRRAPSKFLSPLLHCMYITEIIAKFILLSGLSLGFSSHGTYGAPLLIPGMSLQGMYDGGYTSMGSRYGTGPWGSHDPRGYPQP